MPVYVHLHQRTGDGTRCGTECGLSCNAVLVAYRDLDPERVTCPQCLAKVKP